MTARGKRSGVEDDRTAEEVKRDRQLAELLQELRVALPGVQILFGFLLTVPFAQGFTKVTNFQRDLYFATLLATAAATICLIAPSATHRLRFHQRDRAYLGRVGQPAADRRAGLPRAGDRLSR